MYIAKYADGTTSYTCIPILVVKEIDLTLKKIETATNEVLKCFDENAMKTNT